MSKPSRRYFAEKTSGHKHARLSGSVLVLMTAAEAYRVSATDGTDKDYRLVWCAPVVGPQSPIASWIPDPTTSKRVVEVTEAEARALAPTFFSALDIVSRKGRDMSEDEHAVLTQAARTAATTRTQNTLTWVDDSEGHATSADHFHKLYG